MKRTLIILSLFLLSFHLNSSAFWIWSPKTKEWKNPKYSALATPYLQYKEALKLFEQENYKAAYQEFKKLLVNYPDAKEAAEAQYYLAVCLEEFNKPYEAFLEYQRVIDSYPNSQRINEVVKKQYNIGEFFLDREYKKMLGLSVYDFVEHPSIEIFKKITDKAPYSEYAPRAQYKLGMIFMQLGRYEEARDAFQKTLDNYPDSEWSAPAKYQLAIATAKAFPGADYDSSYLKEATARLDEFIRDHPEAQISSQAQEQLKELRNREAKKLFGIAEFYDRQEHYESALTYYKKVISNYSDSEYYNISLKRAKELKELISKGLKRKDLKQKKKKEEIEDERAARIRLRQTKIEEKQQWRQQKIDEALEEKEKARARKQALLKEKLNKAQKILKTKKALKEKKIDKTLQEVGKTKAPKELIRQEKIKAKQEHRQEILKQKEEARNKKLALRQQKREEKEKRRQAALKRKEDLKAEKYAAREEKIKLKSLPAQEKYRQQQKKIEAKQKLIAEKKALKAKKKKEALQRKERVKAEKIARRRQKKEAKEKRLKKAQDLKEKSRKQAREKIQKLKARSQTVYPETTDKIEEGSGVSENEKDNLYQLALELYINGDYLLAYEKFKEVKKIDPNYHNTDYYLEVISDAIGIAQEE